MTRRRRRRRLNAREIVRGKNPSGKTDIHQPERGRRRGRIYRGPTTGRRFAPFIGEMQKGSWNFNENFIYFNARRESIRSPGYAI